MCKLNGVQILKRLLFILTFSLFIIPSSAQNYFQQDVSYTIHVSLDDVKYELSATESIEYTNHSPDALHEIYLHLWANAYKDDNTALAKEFFKNGDSHFSKFSSEGRGFIDSLDFKVNGEKVNWKLMTDSIDICKLTLEKPLQPGEKITITTPFHVKIPSAFISRLGRIQQSFFITQWYPKPAVFDKNGWNCLSYINQGEFYSEFGTFDVFITLPQNYVVGATGDLIDGEKELQWLNEKAKDTKAITTFSKDMSFPSSSKETKTLHYHQDNVHDFAWFADKRWHVLKEEIELPSSKRKVTAWMMFTNAEADYWMKAPEYMKASIQYFSQWIGNYPYNNVTAVDVTDAEGNGMEYPTITTIGSYGDPFELEVTIAHEIGHNWFYGILGSDERKHPWMDEGMTNFLETRYVYTKYENDKEKQLEEFGKLGAISKHFGLDKLNHRNIQYVDYLSGARNNTDQSPETNAEYVAFKNYHGDVYYKTCLSFDLLKSYLGDSLFDTCMHHYFDEWKFKHPQPEDLKTIFANTSKKNVDWLFDNMIKTTKKIDYKISSIKTSADKNNYSLTLKNAKEVASPLSISSLKKGKIQRTQWLEGFKGKQTINISCDDCDAFKIDAEEKIPELHRKNNTIRTTGLFKKIEPLRFQFAGALEDPSHTQLFFSPTIGWNNYNKFMAGAAFYNIFIPEKKFEYVVMPMYAFGSKTFTGGARATYNIYPFSNYINKISISSGASTYSYYNLEYNVATDGYDFSHSFAFRKLSNELTVFLLNRKYNTNEKSSITLRHVLTNVETTEYYSTDIVVLGNPGASSHRVRIADVTKNFFQLKYNFKNTVTLNPYSIDIEVTASDEFILPTLTYCQKIAYPKNNHGLELRFFVGYAGDAAATSGAKYPTAYHLNMSGQSASENYYAPQDYLFDEVFLGRTEVDGILSQQFTATQGGFKLASKITGQSASWLAAMNLKTSLPGVLPLKLFADIGFYKVPDGYPDELNSPGMYDFGIDLVIIKNIFDIYFPFGYSDNIKLKYNEDKGVFDNYGQKIRFELHLNKLNPLTLIKKIEL